MFTLGHVSDLHIFALRRRHMVQMANKRILGASNLLFKRKRSHDNVVAVAALSMLDALGVDHIAVSGDLTNLAMEQEFKAAAALLHEVRDHERRVSVVPGNHDYYTQGAAKGRRFESHFAPYMVSDLPDYQLPTGYPYCKLLGDDIALVGVNTGIPTPWFVAQGRVDERELRALERLLDDPALEGRCKVVMLHHPLMPFAHAKIDRQRRLINADAVRKVLRQRDVSLAIHGHNHHFSTAILPHLRGHGELVICEAGSSSVRQASDPYFSGKFNIYTFDERALRRIDTYSFDTAKEEFKLWRSHERTPLEAL